MRCLMVAMLLLAGCASTPQPPPEIERITPEELEHLLPQPTAALSLQQIVQLSREGVPDDAMIEKIRQTGSSYRLLPSQAVELARQGVDVKVLDYIHTAQEQRLHAGCADEINKRELQHQEAQDKLRQQLLRQCQLYCDPYWHYRYLPPGDYWWR